MYLRLRLQPRAKKNAVEGEYGDALKIRLTAPPVEGEANKALVAFVAKLLGVKKSAVTIESGEKSRDKRVRVAGLTAAGAAEVVRKALG